eukprot:2099642-Rhodomonas_salina.1
MGRPLMILAALAKIHGSVPRHPVPQPTTPYTVPGATARGPGAAVALPGTATGTESHVLRAAGPRCASLHCRYPGTTTRVLVPRLLLVLVVELVVALAAGGGHSFKAAFKSFGFG